MSRYETYDNGASNDRKDGNPSRIGSYESAIAEMPLQELRTTMKLLPRSRNLPLTLVLHAVDLFSDDEVEKHGLHDVSWTLNFSEFPDHAWTGIETHITSMKKQERRASEFDGDDSGDFGESSIWRPQKRRRLNAKKAKEGNGV